MKRENKEVMVCVRAYRILRHLRNYRHYTVLADAPQYLMQLPTQAEEQLCGIYENMPGTQNKAIVITTRALYQEQDDNWLSVRYNEIEQVNTPDPDNKYTAQTLSIHAKSGQPLELEIKGEKGRFLDLRAFVHFLDRVLEVQHSGK